MTDPEAVRIVGNALNDFGIRTTMPVIYSVTGVALDVVADTMDADSATDTLVYRWRPSMTAHEARALVAIALEALTATNPANPQEK